jgi:hypothetical protein
MHKYIGRRIEIIYMAKGGKLTQRTIHVLSVRNGIVRAYCMTTRAPRTFREVNILAVQPAAKPA